MKSLKYFHINNVKFNYVLEFQSNHINDYWKHNAPLIEYCETIGINIPHYCYHKSLSISGNCRMCLVELKNSPKPLVSCAMSAKSCLNNSEIFTNSPLVKKARENVLEFLLLNHPLDCPICDQGGECDLQDQSLFFGIAKKRFYNFKRVVTDKNIGPIVKTVMTRCIHCTRCVRFAAEIAGTEDLGMFGRGLGSEIGTYVTKTFQSELSGNIIDLCPVGALTSKPYPFVSRSWELKNVSSIDFSDGFATNTQVYLKNNSIVKVNPEYDTHANASHWISDKTRFAFDGMFSPERILKGFVKSGVGKTTVQSAWKTLLDEITMTLYFQDHLSKHFLNTNSLYVVFDTNVSMEIVNLLKMFSNKYSFLKIRKAENGLKGNDLEQNFTTSNHKELTRQLSSSNLCLLVGLNSRYESSSLNVKLRKRYLTGDFRILSLGASMELTFPVEYLGFSAKNLKSIAEGNNLFCQELANSKPTVIVSSNVFQREDSEAILTLLNYITETNTKGICNLNVVNTTINETGINYLSKFKTFNENDLNSSSGLYFLNTSSRTSNLRKIINLKLLGYLGVSDTLPKFCLEQNNGLFANVVLATKSSYKIYNYINLPNSTFFETSGTFLNTEGVFKKTVKFISTNKQTKEDWQIIRKIFACSKNINLTNNYKDNCLLSFNNGNLNKFRNFSGFLSIANDGLTLKENTHLIQPISNMLVRPAEVTKKKKLKIFGTKLKIWINDFYIGGKDLYSKQSSTMIKCSKTLRSDRHTFTHVN
jgi:NADH-quinone oxidoreductase chain G